MDAAHLTSLFRTLAATPSRRGVARAVAGSTLAAALSPLLGLPETDAKERKKKRRRKKRRKEPQPFCAGKDFCADQSPSSFCDDGGDVRCFCWVTAGFGEPFCGADFRNVDSCIDCLAEETCLDNSLCEQGIACALPCPDPM